MKVCTKCNLEKHTSEFNTRKDRPSGLRSHCRDCLKLAKVIFRKKLKRNKKLYKQLGKSKYVRSKEKIKSYVATYLRKKDNGLYSKFYNMLARCNSKSNPGYKWYGEKGIKVEWKKYEDFRKDMYESYVKHIEMFGRKNTTIERINVFGNYSNKNCTWVTPQEQAKNKTNSAKNRI